MSYQVNIHNNTSVYMNQGDENGLFAAVRASEASGTDRDAGSVLAAGQADEGLLQMLGGGDKPAQAANTQVMKTMEQYMELLEQNDASVNDEDTDSEKEDRERIKEIYKNLSSEEIAKLKMMQVDLSSVSLSDISGLVAGIRSEASRQEFNQRIADICGGVDAADRQVMHESLKDAVKSLLPKEMEELNIDSVLKEDYHISSQQMIYLLKNDMQLTISNLYKSEYATSSGKQQSRNMLSEEELQPLLPQIEAVIEQAGITFSGETADVAGQIQTSRDLSGQNRGPDAFMTVSMSREEMIEGAKYMICHDVPLTPSALRNYAAIQDINANGIDETVLAVNILTQEAEKAPPASANVYFNQQEAASALAEMVSDISPEAVTAAEQQGMAMTIRNLAVLTATGTGTAAPTVQASVLEQMSRSELAARRQLEEIRLFMTQSAACRLVMSDLHIDTGELSEVLAKIYELEEAMAKETFADYDTACNDQDVSLYQETMHKVDGLKQMSAAALRIVFNPEPVTINSLYEEGMNQSLYYGQAKESYETMMTTPRSDMGDSIAKAFDRVDSLLQEMGVEPDEETRRAVRILGYNQMEITEDSLSMIMEADAKVNRMLREMTPRAVLDLIRKQQNPLEMSVDELNEVLAENRGDEDVDADERFSRFLYKLEQRNEISEEEKQSFIGIYRLLDKVQKHSGRDIGFVVKAGETLTLKNLLSAHRSSQAKGMDFSVSDENGALESVSVSGTSISQQIESAFNTYGEPVMEQVFLEMQKETPEDYSRELYEQSRDVEFSEEAEEFAVRNQIPYSQGNMQAIDAMLSDEAGIYGMIRNWLSGERVASAYKQREGAEPEDSEEADSVENAAAADNAAGDIEAMFARVAESFEGYEAVTESYHALSQSLTEISYEGVLTHQDIQALKQIHTGFSVLNRMAEQESYQVPLKVDGKWTVLNVHFRTLQDSQGGDADTGDLAAGDGSISEAQSKGSITIDMQHQRYGKITADISTGAEAAGHIETETAGALEWPEALTAKAQNALTARERYDLAKDIFVVLSEL